MNTEVKMKTIVVCWSEEVFYRTVMEVPEEYTDQDVMFAFYELDLDSEKPIDSNGIEINDIFRTHDENVD